MSHVRIRTFILVSGLKKIHLPQCAVQCGRSKGATLTTIVLPKKRCRQSSDVPVPFVKLDLVKRHASMLEMIVFHVINICILFCIILYLIASSCRQNQMSIKLIRVGHICEIVF